MVVSGIELEAVCSDAASPSWQREITHSEPL